MEKFKRNVKIHIVGCGVVAVYTNLQDEGMNYAKEAILAIEKKHDNAIRHHLSQDTPIQIDDTFDGKNVTILFMPEKSFKKFIYRNADFNFEIYAETPSPTMTGFYMEFIEKLFNDVKNYAKLCDAGNFGFSHGDNIYMFFFAKI